MVQMWLDQPVTGGQFMKSGEASMLNRVMQQGKWVVVNLRGHLDVALPGSKSITTQVIEGEI